MQKNIQIFEGKKIGYLITKSDLEGAQKYVLELATEAKNRGADVFVILEKSEQIQEQLEKENVKVFKINKSETRFDLKDKIVSAYEIFNILKSEKPDVFHTNSHKSTLTIFCARILKIRKVILTIHGLEFDDNCGKIQKNLSKMACFMAIFLSHKTISASENAKKQISDFPLFALIKNKILVIHAGVKKFFTYPKSDSRKVIFNFINHKISSHDFLILNMTELNPTNGQLNLITAFENIQESNKNAKLIFLGEGKLKNKIRNIVKNKNLQESVFIPGNLPNAREYLKAFDLVVVPTLSKIIPSCILEAGYAEIPVITSNMGGISEIIENEKNGLLVDTGNISDLSHKMDSLIKDQKMRDRIAEKLKNTVEEKFLISDISIKIFTIYN